MPHYASISRIRAGATALNIAQMLDDDGDGIADSEVVEEVLEATDIEIDSLLSARYGTPLQEPFPPTVIDAADKICLAVIHERRGLLYAKGQIAKDADAARKKLGLIGQGTGSLGIAGPQAAAPTAVVITEKLRTHSSTGRLSA